MKQTMKWLFVEEQGNSVVYRCSVCNSEITVKYGEELPYCKHCESEPDGEQKSKRMTDNEIIKGLKCHSKHSNSCGSSCPYLTCEDILCTRSLTKDALDLINHQKTEIERLEANLKEAFEEIEALKQINLHCKSEAVKEFAERLKNKQFCFGTLRGKKLVSRYAVDVSEIDNLVKEMVGESK